VSTTIPPDVMEAALDEARSTMPQDRRWPMAMKLDYAGLRGALALVLALDRVDASDAEKDAAHADMNRRGEAFTSRWSREEPNRAQRRAAKRR
jgi:hypothetical protein